MTLWISRDWARDGVYAAEIGHDSDNHPHPWVVRVSRTASGRPEVA